MISILLPTRQRPEMLMRMYESAMDLAHSSKDIEMVAYIDDDDNSYDSLLDNPPERSTFIVGPRKVISECWNECWESSAGDIFFHCGDDIVFRTQDWDKVVQDTFKEYDDRIVFLYGDDGNGESERNSFGTHGFIHRNWTDTVGYFVPPYFTSDFNDTFLNDVAKKIGRHRHIDILTEHMHYSLGKMEMDQNTKERLDRHAAERPENIYNSPWFKQEMEQKAQHLREFMESYRMNDGV